MAPISASRLIRAISAALSVFVAITCGGGDSATGPGSSLTVTVQTEGPLMDADGYTVQVGGTGSNLLATNGSVTINGLPTGSQTVTLGGIAPNCAVTGSNPATVQIQSGQNATVAFHVACTTIPGGTYRIALMTNRDPSISIESWEINSVNSDGSVVPLTSNGFFDGYPSWSPDGQKIVFGSDRDGNPEIYVMNADGSNVVRLTNAPTATERFPSWSPDGTKILFESNRDGDTEIYVMNADGSNVTQLTNNATADNGPHFSPDGSKIVFNSNRDAPSTQPPYGNWEIYVMNADGSAQTRVTNDAAIAELPSFLSDTKILFDSNKSAFNNIYVINTDGTGETRLTNITTGLDFLAVASPDQSHVMFTTIIGNHSEVYIMNPDGTGALPLTRQQDGVSNVGYSYRK